MGEMQRLQRYHIIAASLVVAVIWIGVLHFTDVDDVTSIFPLLLFLDATSMSITLIGVSMFFEREEHTLKALFVSPITKGEYMISKIIGNIVSNLQTLVILYLYVLGAGPLFTTLLMLILAALVLAPFTFLYPSRTVQWRRLTLLLSVPYSFMLIVMLIYMDKTPLWITILSFYYPVYYVIISGLLTARRG